MNDNNSEYECQGYLEAFLISDYSIEFALQAARDTGYSEDAIAKALRLMSNQPKEVEDGG